MLALAPLTCFVIIYFRQAKATTCWRSSFLSASLLWGLLLTAITELLSLFRLINFWTILGLWVLSVVLAMICLIRFVDGVKSLNMRLGLGGISRLELSLLVGLAFVVTTVGIIAWISPPNNFDSMTYHMSRVVHWIQNKSVAYYPTHIPRQLHHNPWSEFAILQFQILSGGDRFANLIQWFSMIGTTLGISLLAKQLGASLRGQIFAAVIGVTIPMGILQGSSTQTDYVVSFWLVCFAYYAILLKENGNPLYSLATGASLGFAILTKATAYIYAFPFMVWIGLSLLKSRHTRGLRLIILIITTAFVINLGHYTRNYDLYGSPLGSDRESLANDIITISSVTSNVIRNISLHIGTFKQVNVILENGIYQLHRFIGIDPNDKRTTWAGTEFHVRHLSSSEDAAGNLLHLILITVSIPILMLQQHKKKDTGYYFVCLVGAFVLFCLYLKWQPWHSRLHLPLFLLWSPLIGLLLSQVRGRRIAESAIVILLLGALPWVVFNRSRSIVSILDQESIMTTDRTELYFRNLPSLHEPYVRAAQFLQNSQCLNVGLVLGGNDWEYPFWPLLNGDSNRTVRLEHMNVTNISQVKYNEYPFDTFIPCAIIIVNANPPNNIRMGDVTYLPKWWFNPVSVFMQK